MSIADSVSFSKVVADAGDILYGCQLAIVVVLLQLPRALLYDGVLPVVATCTTSGWDLKGALLPRTLASNVWVVLADGVAKANVPPFAVIVCAQILMACIPHGRWHSSRPLLTEVREQRL